MKKLMIALSAIVLGITSANAGDFLWNWWTTSNVDKPQKTEMKGCSLGIASELKSVQGAQIDILFNKSENVKAGVQAALGATFAGESRSGVQGSLFVNKAKGSALQLGLICVNDTGFLPVFVFFNFTPGYFKPAK